MFAIIKTGGKQYKIKENDTIFVEKLKNKKGDKIDIKDVLLLSNDEKNIKIGTPYLIGVSIKSEVLEQIRIKDELGKSYTLEDFISILDKLKIKKAWLVYGFISIFTYVKLESINGYN